MPDFVTRDSGHQTTRSTLSEQQATDLRKRAEWWWDEAARCGEIGAQGLRRFAVAEAIRCERAAARA